VLPHIFDPFKRGRAVAEASRGRRNLGLGLFIARELVLAHQGTIEVTSSLARHPFVVDCLARPDCYLGLQLPLQRFLSVG